jgi:pimeloyl-ACP methyl ester carboxylesterase
VGTSTFGVRVRAHDLERGSAHADVHAARWEGAGGRVLVCVHGLGGSHLNWTLLAPELAARHGTVWAPDLAGFGHTAPQRRSAGLEGNLDLLRGFLRTVSPGVPVVLVGNSLGALLACSLAGRHPELVDALVLLGPAVPPIKGWPDTIVMSRFAITMTPALGEAWLRRRERWLTPAEQVREALEINTCDADAVDLDLLRAQVRLVAERRRMSHARRAQLVATRSMLARLGPCRRRLWADVAAVLAPTLVLHGGRDRLVGEHSVREFLARRPDWAYQVYPDLGHVVMIEDPARVSHDMSGWLRVQGG